MMDPPMSMPADRERRLRASQDWRFGIMITWGLGSGVGEPKRLTEAQRREREARFDETATRFDASEWVAAGLECGARYMTFVPRHGPGFCLFPTRSAEAHTRRDYTGEIAEECERLGMLMLMYHHLGSPAWQRLVETRFADLPVGLERYHRETSGLLAELAEWYRPAGFWLDGWPNVIQRPCREAGLDPFALLDWPRLVHPVRETLPAAIIGNKVVAPGAADFHETELMFVSHDDEPLRPDAIPTETTDTLPGSFWPAKYSQQAGFLPPEEIGLQARCYTQRLVTAVGRGLNYQLNVGPLPDGEWQWVETEILRRLGDWLCRNGEAIYGTRPGPLDAASWGYNVIRDTRVYLHIMDNRYIPLARGKTLRGLDLPGWQKSGLPADRQTVAGPLPGRLRAAYLLNSRRPVPFNVRADRATLDLRGIETDPVSTVVVLEFETPPDRTQPPDSAATASASTRWR